jgi:hypothetical protein
MSWEFIALGDAIEVEGGVARRAACACLPDNFTHKSKNDEAPPEDPPAEGEEQPTLTEAELDKRMSGQAWGSVAMTKTTLKKFPEGRYAEIELKTDARYTAGSLQVAVTSTSPTDLEDKKLKSLFMIEHARIVDVYGQIWATANNEVMFGYPICRHEGNLEGWDTFVHPPGTRIGLLLRPDGLLFLFLNRQYRASIPTMLHGKDAAYLVVDLQGRCTQVSMLDTRPPRLSAELYEEAGNGVTA